MSSPIGSVGSLVVCITSICPFHRRSPDRALGSPAGSCQISIKTVDRTLARCSNLVSMLQMERFREAAVPGFEPGLAVTGASSMLPCGTEVLDHLCPDPVEVFAVCAPEPQQVGGVVSCQRRQSEFRVEGRAAPGLEGKGLLDQGLRRRGAKQDQGSWFDEGELLSEHLDPLPDLTGPGWTVRCTSPTLSGRAHLDYVGHVYLRAVDPGFFE